MTDAALSGVIELRVPSEPRMMLIVRLTTAGVLAKADISIDAVEDVKLAVEEACNCLIQNSKCSDIFLEYTLTKGEIRVVVGSAGELCRETLHQMDHEELHIIQCILESMIDSVDIRHTDDGLCAIEIRKAFVL